MEVVLVYKDKKVLVNRGFLYGPCCPIYGFAFLLIVIFLNKYFYHPLIALLLSFIICFILEYLTSYVLEILFQDKWWDYSLKKYNINGRVCLETLLPFSLLALLGLYILNPFLFYILNLVNYRLLIIIGLLTFVLYLFDSITSIIIKLKINKMKININNNIKINTKNVVKEINKETNNLRYKRCKDDSEKIV